MNKLMSEDEIINLIRGNFRHIITTIMSAGGIVPQEPPKQWEVVKWVDMIINPQQLGRYGVWGRWSDNRLSFCLPDGDGRETCINNIITKLFDLNALHYISNAKILGGTLIIHFKTCKWGRKPNYGANLIDYIHRLVSKPSRSRKKER